ncbi:restriction endonuclease [Kocuria tytonicola]|uniref:site-specific DNA-methyltransferase (adenine-specific) n=1 Tax=Kocuria tytonicola TaxID=2055946 RepID=A0A3L9L7Z9_9MICC|nr:restriction endonuclease [Kocuria tytonicola]RLY95106.1 restriction endonuclease [Kocuria tytonicola]
MPSSDALMVVNEWISEFYFTADENSGTFLAETKKLVKEWKQESEDSPGYESPLDRVTAARQRILSELIALHAAAAELPEGATNTQRREAVARASSAAADTLREVLGYTSQPSRGEGALRWYSPLDTTEPSIAMIDALASETAEDLLSKHHGLLTADVTLHEEDGQPISSVSELLSALVSEDQPPRYMLVLAGRTVVLTSEDAWPQGRYLAVDVQTVAERGDTKSGGEIQRLLACIAAPSVAPDANGTIWWDARREESVRNAVGVSKDLREGVRESIEIIANEVVSRRKDQGLLPLPDEQAQVLAVQSLRYLYRILFLLYAEASPELGVVPTGDPEYETGYSIDRLRELTLKQLTSRSERGTHFYSSLRVLFDLVEVGHQPQLAQEDDAADIAREGLTFEALRSDLFRRDRTALIDEVQLGNKALQRVLQNLLLTKERKGRDRGFISYVALGINQLGAVYESLMSYTGSFANGTLVELAKHGNPSDGSWVVPEDRVDEELRKHVVMTEDELGREVPRTYHYGEFVFRLSGRQRQQSASYYSPEVLTQFTVQQGLEELLTDEMSAEEILGLSVCEPALGSGAFAIEAVRQLAEAYLERRQAELDTRIDPEEYPTELQRVKAYIALHNVYGVDLNPTAVELAEVSLWLDTMSRGLKAPWFGLRLRSGNSLVGARHAVYDTSVVEKALPKARMTTAPRHVPLDRTVDETTGIFHFLLPAEGWGAAGSNKEIKKLAPEQAKTLREWSKRVHRKPIKKEIAELSSLTDRIDDLWQLARRRMVEAERQSRRSIEVWGADVEPGGAVTREEIEAWLDDPNSAYRRLRLIMDAWCALWFWPVTLDEDTPQPPEFNEWLTVIRQITGQKFEGRKGRQGEYLGSSDSEWETLEDIERMFPAENARDVDWLLAETPWLREAQRIAKEQRFFHWELDFAAVFSRGGFDFQVGNPPWVRPRPDVSALLGESDPWWTLMDKPSEKAKNARREWTMRIPGAEGVLLAGLTDTAGLAEYVGAVSEYPELEGTQPDLYRAFMVQAWRHETNRGCIALIHPPSHLTDANGQSLRRATYSHLRRHWNFLNELQLFGEVDHHVSYSINIYGSSQPPNFLNAISMYHPHTIYGSMLHNGDGLEPGFRDESGKWDLRPHASRIEHVDRDVLATWHALMEAGSEDVPIHEARMVFSVNHSAAEALQRLTRVPTLREWNPGFSRGWDETFGRRDGYFESRWGEARSWNDVILQGPYFHVGNPFYASRNETMRGNQDYSPVDLEVLPGDALPVTEYKPLYDRDVDDSVSTARYDRNYGSWVVQDLHNPREQTAVPVRDFYRVMWRAMAAGTGERTLIPAIFPPGTSTVHSVFSDGYSSAPRVLVEAMGSMSSLISDFLVRATVGSGIFQSAIDRLPFVPLDHPLAAAMALRVLRLNCLTDAYAHLWRDCWVPAMADDSWTGGRERSDRPALGEVGSEWTTATPLRKDEDRRRALVEIDAIMAHVTGIPIDELCTLYRTQFGVLYTYERGEDKRGKVYDSTGRLIPSTVRTAWNKAGRPEYGLSIEDRTYVTAEGRQITAPEPFRILDREADMREAYAAFAERMEQGVYRPGVYEGVHGA